MQPDFFLRTLFFNGLFYILTGVSCIVLLPTLLLPRRYFLSVVYAYVYSTEFLEKYVLGLTFEVRGVENLPQHGSFLVASKHQSAYETLKLHILFKDPAIVLKKELLKIPFWGMYLKKSDVIAIDRSSPKIAVQSVQDGARRMKEQGRPIVIFPQGTRVLTQTTVQERPYKIGIIRMQEATDLPIIPMALNTGVFWPKNSFFKKPGRVVFEFLPSLTIQDTPQKSLEYLQSLTEDASNKLMEEGRQSIPKRSFWLTLTLTSLLLLYCANWFVAAKLVENGILNVQQNLRNDPAIETAELFPPHISGFPFMLQVQFPKQNLTAQGQMISIDQLTLQSWPFWGMPIHILANGIGLQDYNWPEPLFFNSLDAELIFKSNIMDIKNSELHKEGLVIAVHGPIDFKDQPYPSFNLLIALSGYSDFLRELSDKNIIQKKQANMANVLFKTMEVDGKISASLKRYEQSVYLGPIKIYDFPDSDFLEAQDTADGQPSNIAKRRVKPDLDQ